MPFAIYMAIIAAAFSGLFGVALGGYFTALNQKRERQHRRIGDQLREFYGPMLSLRAEILAKSEFRIQISGASYAAWQALIDGALKAGVDYTNEVVRQRFPIFEKILEYNDRQFAEEILPAYRKMVELLKSKMHFAEFSTIKHFAALLEFVEIWNRWLDKSLPAEVLEKLKHSEQKLYPFYEDLDNNFACMQLALHEKHRWWHRSPAVKVLP
jgi:hypothetical protein